jgi:hypothetical protein
MNTGLVIIGSLLPLIILERVLLHVLIRRKRRRLSFALYYLLGLYKPLIIVAGFAVIVISRGEGLLPLIVVLSLGILSALLSYPVARFFHSRMSQRNIRDSELGE